ncbi:uncharacterized protein LOC129756488 [Uranotaenia lowii]|uniref:uncharacterized protein LOC129756488 n=1 Tax=Uranotaenia lowii TaxID=190385 RepID=UPI002479D1CC|nr:uncharacterized protein LOC129756488 [Uranotaenia lowii]
MPPKAVKTFSCSLCKDPDNNHMVQCDRCQSWYHYQCVGVGDSVADRSWLCPSCDKNSTTKAIETLKTNKSRSQLSRASTSNSARAAKAALELQQLQEQKQLELQRIQEETIRAEKEVALAKTRLELEKQQREKEAELERKRLDDERKRQEAEQEFEQLKLKQDKIRQEALRKLEEKFLAEKYRILNAQLDEDCSRKSDYSDCSGRRTKQWVEDLLDNHEVAIHEEKPSEGNPKRCREPLDAPKQPLNSTELVNPNRNPRNLIGNEIASRNFEFPVESPIRGEQNLVTVPQAVDRQGNEQRAQRESELQNYPSNLHIPSGFNTLTSNQLAARSVFSKELPTFAGNPEEWPLFYSSYLTGTRECGLTNAENLIRLQRCLKGEALEAVRSSLLIPETVPCAIETLEMCYGRPDVLINALLIKIRNTPAPKEGRLESLIAYGLAIKNFCNHILAANLKEHFTNPTLLQELVEKLPTDTKMKWADYMELTGEKSLDCFGRFMHEVVRKAITVTSYNPQTVTKPARGEDPRSKGGMKFRGYLNLHSEARASDADDKDDQHHFQKICKVCGKPGHTLDRCGKFETFSIDERLKAIRIHNLCKSCLKNHLPWPCRRPKDCTYEGCRLRHHPLLHSSPPEGRTNPSPNNFHRANRTAIYRIIPVTVHNGSLSIPTFALLDEASEVTMIEQNLADNLNLKGSIAPLHLQWTSNVSRVEENSRTTDILISGQNKSKCHCLKNARTVEVLELPVQTIRRQELDKYPHLRGLPIADYEHARPQLLIGLENIHLATPLKICEGPRGQPIATKTRLGWCIYGGISYNRTRESYQQLFHGSVQTEDEKLHEVIKQHVVIDNLGILNTGVALESDEDKHEKY